MDREYRIRQVSEEIERLAKMHILYRIEQTPIFQSQKERVKALISSNQINVRTDLDPVSRNLFRRYLG